MRKGLFIQNLRRRLNFMDRKEREEVIKYYDELIQDAIDNNEDEEQFILGLGRMDDLVKNIKDDDTFVTQVKEKRGFTVTGTTLLLIRIIGYFIYFIIFITAMSVAFSFIVSGFAIGVQAIFKLIVSQGETIYYQIMYAGNIMAGIGLILLGSGIIQLFIRDAKKGLKKIFLGLQKLFV